MPGYEVFGEEERKAINELFELNGGILFAHGFDVIRNGVYKVREFEANFAKKMGTKHAQAVSSGSAALRVALEAIDVAKGDEVIIPAFTFVATAEAVIQVGAELVIVDIDDSFNISPSAFEAAITKKTKAVIVVHMMGAPANMAEINKIAKKNNIKIIEDACQAVGGTYMGKNLGTIGDVGCYSFDAGKVMITGEGGMITTNSYHLFDKARAYHDHGHEYSTTVSRGVEGAIGVGFNYRMTEIQGAIGLVQLSKLDMIIERQRKNKRTLKEFLVRNGFPYRFRRIEDEGEIGDSLIFILEDKKNTDSYLEAMKAMGIPTKNVPDAIRWHFAKHWKHMFEKYGWYRDNYQSAWQISADLLEKSIAIPIFINMSEERIVELADKLMQISRTIK